MAQYTPEYLPTGDEIAVIKTSKGDIRVQLAGKDAPIHVGNFVELARKGFYDGLKFHRYVPGFVIQGGCPNTRDLTSDEVVKKAGNPFAGLGTGGPGYSIKEEYSTKPQQQAPRRRSRHGTFTGSQFCRLAVLFVPRSAAYARLGLYGVRTDGRGQGRHRPAACG